MLNVKLIVAIAISLLPLNQVRRLLYRVLLGYSIDQNSKIAFATVIAVDSATIEGVNIGMFNRFIGPYSLLIKKGTSIGRSNEFYCGGWAAEHRFSKNGYERFCHIGEDCLITRSHYFDTTGGISIGDRSWIAGCYSQFWSHGIGVRLRTITIGSDCYIGSAVRFAPGASIGENNVVGLGAVVVGSVDVDNALIVGVPAKVVQSDYNGRTRNLASRTHA